MTVGELKNKLEGYEDDMIIVFQPVRFVMKMR